MKRRRTSKKMWIAAFYAVAGIMASIIMLHHNPLAVRQEELIKKVIACCLIVLSCAVFTIFYDRLTVLPVELYENRKLIWKLAKNDFKKRYAGSYLGIIWALIQPVVTVFMYWFVFENFMGSKAQFLSSGTSMPYVLFLAAGLCPWFYFSEALNNGTTALLEYNYLVKKVVFKISILPIIKIIAATFIHLFFVLVLLVVAFVYKCYPTVYTIQILYYSVCLFILVLGMCYTTCAIVVFFRDLSQIISIVLQVGMWATPILWSISVLDNKKPIWKTIIKLNPLVYIVNGYRGALCEKAWFFEDFYSTIYFWIFTVVVFGIGALIFKRLKVHFADVL